MAECVAVIRYIYITHVFPDKSRENEGLVQITSSQNILLLSATSTSCLHGAPLARRPPFLLCDMPKSKRWLCSRVLCLVSVMEIIFVVVSLPLHFWPLFWGRLRAQHMAGAAAVGQKSSVSSLTLDQNPRAVLPAPVGKHMGTEERWAAFSCDFPPCKESFIISTHKAGSSLMAFMGLISVSFTCPKGKHQI